MRGDFSRIRLSQGKGYTSVLEQQGRVALDADANEQQFLDDRLRRAETVDVIGQFGGPAGDEGLAIGVSGGDITIGAGRYYLAGLLCENQAQLTYDSQPYLKVPAGTGAGLLADLKQSQQPGQQIGQLVLQVYLQAWQRLVTALDDPCLREPALGQADTTVRTQTVWRVMVSQQSSPGSNPGSFCSAMPPLSQPVASTGTLTVTTGGPAADCGCGPVAAAGYQGIENQLYRVEIQQAGDETGATFKWSRENGSVVVAVTGVAGAIMEVDSLGPDANLGFSVGDWVELTDDTWTFGLVPNNPGTLYQIQNIDKDHLKVTLAAPVADIDPGQNARMRRWDQSGPSATATGIPLPVGPAVMELENGIHVSFGAGSYQAGDYWTIPARTATGTIEWPPCGSDGNPAQPPCSIEVYEAPLAVVYWYVKIIAVPEALETVSWDEAVARETAEAPTARVSTAQPSAVLVPIGGGHGPVEIGSAVVEDCRTVFSPLTALTPPGAIHVTAISWANDDVMALDTLVANPLMVTLDQTIAGRVSGGNFIVTIEPFALPESQVPQTSVILGDVGIVGAEVAVVGQVLWWTVPLSAAQDALQSILKRGTVQGQFPRARVRLPGYAYFVTSTAEPIYLDGRALGQPGIRADGVTPRVDLRWPSGVGSVTSDFESWFYLAPAQAIASVSITPSDLTAVVNDGAFTGVETTPVGSVSLLYPAVSPVTVTLTLTSEGGTGNQGVGTVASVPASVTVPAGAQSAPFTPTFAASPPAGQTYSFLLTASTTSTVVSDWSFTESCYFSVTAPPPAPVVMGISPTSGPMAGGETVTVTGTGFTGATGVNFGSVAATNLNVASDTQLTVTSPAATASGTVDVVTVDVTVATPAGTSATSAADKFTYGA